MKGQREFVVTWQIQLSATSHKDAAVKALAMQRDPTSIATFFEVVSVGDRRHRYVDLLEKHNKRD